MVESWSLPSPFRFIEGKMKGLLVFKYWCKFTARTTGDGGRDRSSSCEPRQAAFGHTAISIRLIRRGCRGHTRTACPRKCFRHCRQTTYDTGRSQIHGKPLTSSIISSVWLPAENCVAISSNISTSPPTQSVFSNEAKALVYMIKSQLSGKVRNSGKLRWFPFKC